MNKIQPMAVERSEDGWWTHPDMPEIETSEQFNAWQAQQGFQLCIVMLDGDAGDGTEEAYKTYFDAANADCSSWQPSKPEGDGWFIVSIHDSEDGPACIWIRHPTEEQLREAEERKKLQALKEDFLAKHKACEKAAYEYFVACPEGDERIFASETYQNIRLAFSRGKGARGPRG